jgi:hypothetical protein
VQLSGRLSHHGRSSGVDIAIMGRDQRLEHDPEKWKPVSRLREAQAPACHSFDASAGEGRSEKIMLKR